MTITRYPTAALTVVSVPTAEVVGILTDVDLRFTDEPCIDRTCVAAVCLDCGTTMHAADPEQVALLRREFDLTCCRPETTLFV